MPGIGHGPKTGSLNRLTGHELENFPAPLGNAHVVCCGAVDFRVRGFVLRRGQISQL